MKKYLWSKSDLIIAYYLAKCGIRGLNISKPELVKEVIRGTTLKSLNMQVAGFRNLLGLDGVKLNSTSQLKIELVNELSKTPNSILRQTVLNIIQSSKETFTEIIKPKEPYQHSLF